MLYCLLVGLTMEDLKKKDPTFVMRCLETRELEELMEKVLQEAKASDHVLGTVLRKLLVRDRAMRLTAAEMVEALEFQLDTSSISTVLASMKSRPDLARLLAEACSALANLTEDDEKARVTLAAEGGIEIIVKAMEQHGGDEVLQSEACKALRIISRNGSTFINTRMLNDPMTLTTSSPLLSLPTYSSSPLTL